MKTGSVVQIGGAVRHNPLPPLTPFYEHSLVDVTGEKNNTLKNGQVSSLGGFIGGGQLAWRANGPTIEVFDPLNCSRLAAWTFGAILHNASAKITCVCSIGAGTVTHVVVGLDLGDDHNPRGLVCVLSLKRSRITRAFPFCHKVTNVCMVTFGDKLVDPSTLSPELRSCQGLLAVATGHAFLYLVDLALDLGADKITSDEVSPAAFVHISIPDAHAEIKRNEAVSREYHSLLCLSENFSSGGSFTLLGPDDNILFEAPSHTIEITSLLYVPQLASLIVGYSFGSFQIINLSIITVDCASPYEDNLPPVFSFAYQEPENDPRSFVYLWVCRSWSFEKDRNKSELMKFEMSDKATCSLYAMNYEKKEWIEGYGLWYQGLQSMSPRFEFDATGGIGHHSMSLKPSKIFSAMTVVGMTPTLASPLNSGAAYMIAPSDEESDPVPELSLCTFCWEGKFLDHGREVIQHYIAIFDINQWYQAQMPGHLRLLEDTLCPYMSFHIMDKVPKSANEKLLSAAPKIGSWSRHSSKSRCENDWYPSSLSYEFHLLTSEGLVTYRCPSVQQTAILELTQLGPGAIVNPHVVFNACIFAGIISPDTTLNYSGSAIVTEREQLLNIALEYHLLSLIVQCVVEFSEGRFSHVGCSLLLLLDWAWNKIIAIKDSYDTVCVPLFSSTETSILSDAELVILHQNLTYLSHLHTIVKTIKDNAGVITVISAGELEGRVQVVQLLEMHLRAILWFYHAGLLPQCNQDDHLDGKSVPFPAKALRNLYDQRRKDIKNLNPILNPNELLLIDCMLEESGSLLVEIWSEEGREDAKTIYPPPSISSLLNMYLLPGMTTPTKHRIIQYLFLDLVSLLSDNYLNVVEEFVKFPASISMSPSINKLTQAFWLIDQKDFETGLSVLLDPLINPGDITPKQHQRIIKAFLFQGEEAHALSYIQLRHPPEMNLEDIQINLSVLLANGRIREAYHYQQKRRVASNAKELLQHFFTACERLGRLESVVHLPLSPIEEESFINYLNASFHSAAQDILLVYYLQQSRFGEITELHDKAKGTCNSTYNGQKTRNALISGYLSHLPDIRAQTMSKPNPKGTRTMFTKPQPLSACIRQSASSSLTPKTNAKVIFQNILGNDRPNASVTKSIPYTPFRSKVQRRKAIKDWTEDVGLINKSVGCVTTELGRSHRNTSKVVFPTYQDDAESWKNNSSLLVLSSAKLDTPSLSKQSCSYVKDVTSLEEDVSKAMEDILRKSFQTNEPIENIIKSSQISKEVIALLKTPPVHKKSFSHIPINESLSDTPQSILKVRKILQRSQSPCGMESPVPSFPLHRSLAKSFSFRETSTEKSIAGSESGSLTPKQLRFDIPSRKLSVDVNNCLVIESSKVLNPLVQESGIKRKRSDESQSSLSDIVTPRKPLPKYADTNVKLPFGLMSESDFEEEELSPAQSISFTSSKVTKVANSDYIVRETTETRSESRFKVNSISSCDNSLDFNVTSTKVDIRPAIDIDDTDELDVITAEDYPGATFSHENKVPYNGKPCFNFLDSENYNFSQQKSINSTESSKCEFINETHELNESETATNTSVLTSSAEVYSISSKNCVKDNTLRLNTKDAKKLLNHVHESFSKSPEKNDTFDDARAREDGKEAVRCFLSGIFGSDNKRLNNEFSKVGKLDASQCSFSSNSLLANLNNSVTNRSSSVRGAISNPENIGAMHFKAPYLISSNDEQNVESNELCQKSLEATSRDPEIFQVVKQKMDISVESIDEVFENAVENLSYSEDFKTDSQLSRKNKSKVDVGKILNDSVSVSESNTQFIMEEQASNNQASVINTKIGNIKERKKELKGSLTNMTCSDNVDFQNEPIPSNEKGNNTSKLGVTVSIPMYLIDREHISKSDLNDYLLPHSDLSKNIDLPELKAVKDSSNSFIEFSECEENSADLVHSIEAQKADTSQSTLPASNFLLESLPISMSCSKENEITITTDDYTEKEVTYTEKFTYMESEVSEFGHNSTDINSQSNRSYIPVIEFSDEENENTDSVVVFETSTSKENLNIVPSVLQTNMNEANAAHTPPKDRDESYIPVVEFSDEENDSFATSIVIDININGENNKLLTHKNKLNKTELNNPDQSSLQVANDAIDPFVISSERKSVSVVKSIVVDNEISKDHNSTVVTDVKLNDTEVTQQEKKIDQSLIPVIEFSGEVRSLNERADNKDIIENITLSKVELAEPVNDQFGSKMLKNECHSIVSNEDESLFTENKDKSLVGSCKTSEISPEFKLHIEGTDETDNSKVVSLSSSKNNAVESNYDGYHSDDSAKTVEFDIDLINNTVKESFVPLPAVAEALEEGDESMIIETNSVDNNNISKIKSIEQKENWTPNRRKKTIKGLDSSLIIEENTPSSAPATPLRRSRRLSSSTPTKGYETPKRRQRRTSEVSEADDEEGNALETSVTFSKGKTTSTKRNKGSSSTEPAVEEIIPNDSVPFSLDKTPLKVEKERNLPSTPMSGTRLQRSKKSDTTPRVDTPIRRSSRLSATHDALNTIVEENNVVLTKTPLKKTPLRSKRKSIVPNLESFLETIKEDSELKNSETIDSECLNRLSPLEAASTTAVNRTKRGQSLDPETPNSSLSDRRRMPKGRRKSASVSPELLSKSFGRGKTSIESTHNKDENHLEIQLCRDQATYKIISPASNEIPLATTINTKNTNGRRSYARKKSSLTLELAEDIDMSLELPVNRKTYRRKTNVLSSTLIEINRKDVKSANGASFNESEENVFADENVKENGLLPDKFSPVVTYKLLDAPDHSKKLGILRASSNTNERGRKRKQSSGRGITSLSVPLDSEDSNIDIVPPKRQRKSSASKKKTSTSSTSESDANYLRKSSNSDKEEINLVKENEPEITSSVSHSKSGARKPGKKR